MQPTGVQVCFIYILLNIDFNARLTTTLHDKRDDFDSAIINFPFLYTCSNIQISPAYGVNISQLIQYARTCFAYEINSMRGKLLTKKLMLQGYNESRLEASFRNSTVAIMTLYAITSYAE
jgi:hypothetical protein